MREAIGPAGAIRRPLEARDGVGMMSASPRIEERPATAGSGFALGRVRIRNYKSIDSCDVELKPFTLLVGRNGAGKSNFVGAIRLVSEGLRDSLLQVPKDLIPWAGAFRVPGREFGALPEGGFKDATIHLEFTLEEGRRASYRVVLRGRPGGFMAVIEERLEVGDDSGTTAYYHCRAGRPVEASIAILPPFDEDRLYLVRASGVAEFRPAFDALANMAVYNLAPASMRSLEPMAAGPLLARDGSNLAAAFDAIASRPDVEERLMSYFRVVVPEFARVYVDARWPTLPPFLVFGRDEPGRAGAGQFLAQGVSDGTLRAFGILVAVNQLASDGRPIRLVGIEEPEAALHPAASGALMDALREASTQTQVLVTTHGADLLDLYDPEEDLLLAVEMRGGRTEIGPVNRASREAIRERLYSAGELLRMDHLDPERSDGPKPGTATSAGGEPRS